MLSILNVSEISSLNNQIIVLVCEQVNEIAKKAIDPEVSALFYFSINVRELTAR